jgi:hypothetical protein
MSEISLWQVESHLHICQHPHSVVLPIQDHHRMYFYLENAPMYRGWKNSVYHRYVILPLWQCESKHQHQNYAENRWQTVKRYTNRVMDRSGFALSYVIFCLNHCVDPNLANGTKSPLQVATFLMTDISSLLYFYF